MYNRGPDADDGLALDLRQFQRRFAAQLRALREKHGLRQEDLENYGLSWKTVQKLEYGLSDPKVSTLLKLCRAFSLTLPDLLRLDEQKRKS